MDNQDQQPKVPTVASYWPGSATENDTTAAPYTRSKKTKKDLLSNYDRRLKMSAKWRKDEYERTWKRLIDLYRGKQFTGLNVSDTGGNDQIAVNISFATVNTIVPSVAVNYPKMTVRSRSPELDDSAHIVEAAVNYWWREYEWREEIKRVVKDSLVIGHGWAKVGWKYKAKDRKLSDQEQFQHYQQMQGQAQQAAAENPAIAADLPSDEDIAAGVPETEPDVIHDHPFVERVSPFDIFIDPEATSLVDLKWVAQRIVAPIERVRNDSRYNASARKALKPDMSANPRWRDDEGTPSTRGTSEKRNDDIQRVTLYEYWDIEHDFYCVYAKGADSFLLDPTDNPYPFPIPFVPLQCYEVPDQFYSLGELEMLEPLQHELNAVRSDMKNHRKRWQRAYLAQRDKLDPAAQNSLLSDKDGRIVWVDGDEDLTRIVHPIQQIPLDAQFYTYSKQIEEDIQQVSGITEYQKGVAPEITRTATEANMLANASNARVSDKLAVIELFMGKIAERVIQLAQTYMTGDDVARIMGPNGQQAWVQFTRDDIQGEFDFVVDAGSTQPRDEKWRRESALEMLKVLGPYMNVMIDGAKLISHVLQDGFLISNPSDYFVQQPYWRPQERLMERMNYKDMPPDIQRQMEEQAGFQRSTMGGSSPMEQLQMQHQADQAALAQEQQGQNQQQTAEQTYEQQLQMMEHTHDHLMQQQEPAPANGQQGR